MSDLFILLAKKILFHHATTYWVIEIFVLFKCLERNRSVDLLKIAIPETREVSVYVKNQSLEQGQLTEVGQTSCVQCGPTTPLLAQ